MWRSAHPGGWRGWQDELAATYGAAIYAHAGCLGHMGELSGRPRGSGQQKCVGVWSCCVVVSLSDRGGVEVLSITGGHAEDTGLHSTHFWQEMYAPLRCVAVHSPSSRYVQWHAANKWCKCC
jgi:hypothetical protein